MCTSERRASRKQRSKGNTGALPSRPPKAGGVGLLACPQCPCFPEHAPEWLWPPCTPGPRLVVPESGLPQYHPAVPTSASIQGNPFPEGPTGKIPFHMREIQPFFPAVPRSTCVQGSPGECSFVPQIHPGGCTVPRPAARPKPRVPPSRHRLPFLTGLCSRSCASGEPGPSFRGDGRGDVGGTEKSSRPRFGPPALEPGPCPFSSVPTATCRTGRPVALCPVGFPFPRRRCPFSPGPSREEPPPDSSQTRFSINGMISKT